ncbi:MAG TPA: GNAT family N-acetyltransferase [Bradyrhizobium sp.]|jgi:CelD/BcsL family acetyltransferase involved in cellulose biosynthesis|nr:GNAT family N-acetyltransferase [Bradyrhizobium sp.]
MAMLEVGRLNGHAVPAIAGFRVDFIRDWKAAAACWGQAGHGTAFQHARWLEAWYDVFDSVRPLIAIIFDQISGRQIALLPLICRVHGGIRVVEFADLNITDYNAPILSQGILLDEAQSRALCKTLLIALRRLPERPDLVRLKKMPSDIQGKPNPLVVLGRLGSSSLNGNLIVTGDDFEVYRHSIKRMQLPRSWRVFGRYPGATFRLVTNVGEALKTLDTMDVQQRARMQRIGLTFVLHEEPCAIFYRSLVSSGLESGETVVSALTCDEATVATVLGVRQGDYFVFLRISNAGTRWSHCSPSRLIIERTMAALHEQGVRQFDLSIGNYAFKRRFGAVQFPLTDASIALGWRGIPYVLRDRAAQWLRGHPWLASKVGRALGRLSHEE